MFKKTPVVDGAKFAYIEKSHKLDPKVSNILAVRSAMQEMGHEPEVE